MIRQNVEVKKSIEKSLESIEPLARLLKTKIMKNHLPFCIPATKIKNILKTNHQKITRNNYNKRPLWRTL